MSARKARPATAARDGDILIRLLAGIATAKASLLNERRGKPFIKQASEQAAVEIERLLGAARTEYGAERWDMQRVRANVLELMLGVP